MNTTISEMDFLEYVKEYKVTCLEYVDISKDNKFIKVSISEEEFIKLAKEKNKTIFYKYHYPTREDVLITGYAFSDSTEEVEDLIEKLNISEDFYWFLDEQLFPEEIQEESYDYPQEFSDLEYELLEKIKAYNDEVDLSVLNTPIDVFLLIIDNGYLIGCNYSNEKTYKNVQDSLYEILSNYKKEIKRGAKIKEEKIKNAEKELEQIILNDSNFILATNQKARRHYAQIIAKNEEVLPLLKILFPSSNSYMDFSWTSVEYYIDSLFILHKKELSEKRKVLIK